MVGFCKVKGLFKRAHTGRLGVTQQTWRQTPKLQALSVCLDCLTWLYTSYCPLPRKAQ